MPTKVIGIECENVRDLKENFILDFVTFSLTKMTILEICKEF